MLGFLFGWRRAFKCKKLIKQLQCRLMQLKNKRCSIVRFLRQDIAELIKICQKETALNRAGQLYRDENIVAVYELLEIFCEFISLNMSYIRKRKDIPNDINEAISSLVYASARCGELPELRVIRRLFEERYGQRFAVDTLELFPENLVNFQIKERLSITSVPDYVKHHLVDEIANNYCLQPEFLALEYTSELQQVLENRVFQELDEDVHNCYGMAEDCERKTSTENKMQDIYVDPLLTGAKTTRSNESTSHSPQNSDAVSTLFSSSSIVLQSSPDDASNYLMIDKSGKEVYVAKFDSQFGFKGTGDDHAKERQINGRNNINTASSSESLPQFQEEKVVYLDDIEEFQFSKRKDGHCQDQRLFKFKQSLLPKPETVEYGCNGSFLSEDESETEKSSSRSSRKSVKALSKKPKRRSLSRECSWIKDIECEIYYEKPYKSPENKQRSHYYYHRKQKKKPVVEDSKQACYYLHKRLSQAYCCKESGNFEMRTTSCHCQFGCEMNDCISEHSCYYCKDDDVEKEREFQHCKLHIGTTRNQNRGSEEDVEKHTLPQKLRRKSYDNGGGATEYNVFTNSDHWPKEQTEKNNGNAKASDSPMRCAASEEAASRTRNKAKPPYLTVKTIPPERTTKANGTDNIMRFSSFPCQYPDHHIHPKLPDYDDIAAKFIALKKERLQNQH